MSAKTALKKMIYPVYTFPKFKKMYARFLRIQSRFEDMSAQRYLRRCFIESNGAARDWAHGKQRKLSPYVEQNVKTVMFQKITEKHLSEAVFELEDKGYWVFPFRLSKSWVDTVKSRMMNLHVSGRQDSSDVQLAKSLRPKEATYWYKQSDLLEIEEIRALIEDSVIRKIVGRYLGCEPVYDFSVAWWSFPSVGGPDSSAAQLFHFDLDRVKWLKVFVYLTDVGETNGPHLYIKGSHRTIGKKISRDGRFSDEEVLELYSKEDEAIITGPAGTIFIEDTIGFHKGLPVKEGRRLVFEFECSINHFGYPHPPTRFD